jgi:hypothetical protein
MCDVAGSEKFRDSMELVCPVKEYGSALLELPLAAATSLLRHGKRAGRIELAQKR